MRLENEVMGQARSLRAGSQPAPLRPRPTPLHNRRRTASSAAAGSRTISPRALHLSTNRSFTAPANIEITGTPHAEATCPPAESYPINNFDRAISAANDA